MVLDKKSKILSVNSQVVVDENAWEEKNERKLLINS